MCLFIVFIRSRMVYLWHVEYNTREVHCVLSDVYESLGNATPLRDARYEWNKLIIASHTYYASLLQVCVSVLANTRL